MSEIVSLSVAADNPLGIKEGAVLLKYDFNEICDAETLCGCNLMQPVCGGGMSGIQTRALLYALLKPTNSAITVKEAGALLTFDMSGCLGAITQVLKQPRGLEDEAEQLKAAE